MCRLTGPGSSYVLLRPTLVSHMVVPTNNLAATALRLSNVDLCHSKRRLSSSLETADGGGRGGGGGGKDRSVPWRRRKLAMFSLPSEMAITAGSCPSMRLLTSAPCSKQFLTAVKSPSCIACSSCCASC